MPCLQVLQLILWLCPCVFKWLVIYAALRSLPQILHDTFPSWRTMCVRSLSLVAKAAVHVYMKDNNYTCSADSIIAVRIACPLYVLPSRCIGHLRHTDNPKFYLHVQETKIKLLNRD